MICDIEAIAAIAHDAGVPLIGRQHDGHALFIKAVDWGADIIVHSATKFLGGHGNSMAGLIVDGGKFNWGNGKFPTLSEPCPSYHGHEDLGDLRRHGLCHCCRVLRCAISAFARTG